MACFDVPVCVQRMLEGDIRWREGWGDGAGMLAWHAQSLEEVVGMPEDEYEQHYWSRFLTYDQDDGGCPVFYRWCVSAVTDMAYNSAEPTCFGHGRQPDRHGKDVASA